MIDYESLFYPLNQHVITIRNRADNKAYTKTVYKNKHVEKILRNQCDDCDVYITKYPLNYPISLVILDFDSDDDKEEARADAMRLKEWIDSIGLNSFIVDSGKKGYHVYLQVPPHAFMDCEFLQVESGDYNLRFLEYIDALIDIKQYSTLDMNNYRAGLRGNIRLIGSTHPVSLNECKIIEGCFKPEGVTPVEDDDTAYRYAFFKADKIESEKPMINPAVADFNSNPVESNDLRELMPSIFGGKVKRFKDYVMLQCPFHNDNNPSLYVGKEFYYCKSCGSKGNWWTLKKNGYVDFDYKYVELEEVF